MQLDAHSMFSTKVWQPGSQPLPILLDRYQILGTIGEGGMGTVFKGFHLHLKRFVAVKTLRIGQVLCPELVSRFLKEMELVGQMDHANVVRASDAWRKNDVLCLVMEYLEGQDLHHYLRHRGPLELAPACEVTRQVAVGLDYVHRTLVHRDIKPSNLMLTTSGQVKILDLGLARFSFDQIDELERTPEGMAIGTFAYMAPEQGTRGALVDGRADIYSLGCTLFKLLTGHAPFGAPEFDNAVKVLAAHTFTPIEKAPRFAMIPEPIQDIVRKMTAKNPEDRFANGQQVADALTPFVLEHTAAQLSWQADDETRTPLQPLTWPLPEVLSRLTELPAETQQDTPGATSEIKGPVKLKPISAGMSWLLMACIMLAVISVPVTLVAMIAILPRKREVPPEPAVEQVGLRDLDKLQGEIWIPLLDREPAPIGVDKEVAHLRGQWDKGLERLAVTGPGVLIYPLAKTAAPRYRFEVAIDQTPWTGQVGVIWGYRGDANVMRPGMPQPAMARYQFLCLYQHNKNGVRTFSIQRGVAVLYHNALGAVDVDLHEKAKADIPNPREGPQILSIEVQGQRLSRALLGGLEMTRLFDAASDQDFADESNQGGLGIFSIEHDARFSNARYIRLPNN